VVLVSMVGVAVAGALLGMMAAEIGQANQAARQSLEERQASRMTLARQFVDAYTADVLARVGDAAEASLAGVDPSPGALATAARQLRFDAAVLLDDQGRLLQVLPQSPGLVGQRLSDRYDHLRIAVAGRANVSVVVPSAASATPIVAFAVPFPTPQGTRVLSGGFSLASSPLGAFLRSFSAVAGNAVYLVDTNNRVVAANDPLATGTLAERDAGLATAVSVDAAGHYTSGGEDRFFTSEAAAGAPWHLVISVPTDGLYASVTRNQSIPWLIFGAFAAASLVCAALLARVTHQRQQLLELAERDMLTGLSNRRHVDTQLVAMARRAARTGRPVGVFLIDVDHFKLVNDHHGHPRGDQALQDVAHALQASVRPADVVARWGGEEFMVLAPDISVDDAAGLAERLRSSVADNVTVDHRPVTVSIGYTTEVDNHGYAAASRADRALYRAKAHGRNCAATGPTHDSPALALT
jgi:diguanylate cyclase (GGDEF)-like protein